MIVAPLVLLVGFLILLGFFACWTLAAIKLFRGQPLLAYEARKVVPWGLIDLVLLIFLLIAFQGLAVNLFLAKPPPVVVGELVGDNAPALGMADLERNKLIMLVDAGTKLAVMMVVTPLLMLRTGCTWRDLGVVPKEAGRDIAIGLATFCMLAPIVFGIQAALTQLAPYKHPMIEMLTKTPDLQLFAVMSLSAVILAPLSEEWAFRVLLQGWLEKLLTYAGSVFHILAGGRSEPPLPAVLSSGGPLGGSPSDASGIEFVSASPAPAPPSEIQWLDPANPYAPPRPLASDSGVTFETPNQPAVPAAWKLWAATFLSAILFALMHFSHGLAWIPLTLLAIGLGYIYQRTHRILPSITVHFCLNALSMAAFWVQMFEVPQFKK